MAKPETFDVRDLRSALLRKMSKESAERLVREVNRARLDREIGAEQARQKALIEKSERLSGAAWLLHQDLITASFYRIDALLKEYSDA